jgi:hypothetical protein
MLRQLDPSGAPISGHRRTSHPATIPRTLPLITVRRGVDNSRTCPDSSPESAEIRAKHFRNVEVGGSSPLTSARCQNCNVLPGQRTFFVSGRSPMLRPSAPTPDPSGVACRPIRPGIRYDRSVFGASPGTQALRGKRYSGHRPRQTRLDTSLSWSLGSHRWKRPSPARNPMSGGRPATTPAPIPTSRGTRLPR